MSHLRPIRLVILIGLAATLGTRAVMGQAAPRMPKDAANLIVQVLVYSDESGELDQMGAGIVVAATNRIVIATAAHVVRAARVGARTRIVFQFARGDTVDATVHQSDGDLDLAVLSVARKEVQGTSFAFDREGDAAGLAIGEPVIPVGCPNAVCWEPPVSRDRVIAANARRITFESFFISPGSSGGALFNRYWEIVGLVTEKADPEGRAIGVIQMADRLREWGYTVQLRRKKLPRAGYRTRVSLSGLAPTSGSLYESGRWPSGRVAVLFKGQRRIGWHLAAVRLAPDNLAVSAAMGGLDLRIDAGPLAVSPFVELGAARVEGRFDAGGHSFVGPNGSVYEPYWNRRQDDVVGLGGGGSLEVDLFPHVAIEAIAGHWSFRVPSGLPKVPNVFAGAGLRLGF